MSNKKNNEEIIKLKEFKKKLDETKKLSDFFEVLKENPLVDSGGNIQEIKYNIGYILYTFDRIIEDTPLVLTYGAHTLVNMFSDVCKFENLWEIIISMVRGNKNLKSEYKVGILSILGLAGCDAARELLVYCLVYGGHGIDRMEFHKPYHWK